MKSKSAEATASALRNYISFMGVPKVLLTDNDPTFRSEVTTLLASFNIQHQTYKELMAKKSGYKRKRSPSPSQSTSQSPKVDHSVSKRIKTPGGGATPVLSFYSQEDYNEDALIEVVMNMDRSRAVATPFEKLWALFKIH